MTVADVEQLFDGFDRSPQPHLAEGVERFIVHRAQETASAVSLTVRLRGGSLPRKEVLALSRRLRFHFAHRADEEQLKVRNLVHAGLRDLVIGIIFLFICAAAGLLAARMLAPAPAFFVEQGLLILGWVALWRPVDLFLYELRPVRLHRKILDQLARMDVQFEKVDGRSERLAA